MPDFKTYISLWWRPVLLLELLIGLPIGLIEARYLEPSQDPSGAQLAVVLVFALIIIVIGMAGLVLQTLWFRDASEGQRPEIVGSLRQMGPPIIPLVATNLALVLVAGLAAGLALLLGLLPNLFLAGGSTVLSQAAVYFAGFVFVVVLSAMMFVTPIVVIEQDWGLSAVRRAWRLVRRRPALHLPIFMLGWGPTFGVSFVADALIPEPHNLGLLMADVLLYFVASLWMAGFSAYYFYLYRGYTLAADAET